MTDKHKMSELFRQDDYHPDVVRIDPTPQASTRLSSEAGLHDIRQSYPTNITPTDDRLSDDLDPDQDQLAINANMGNLVQALTAGHNPEAFDAWLQSRPESPNVEATFNARWGALPQPRKDQARR